MITTFFKKIFTSRIVLFIFLAIFISAIPLIASAHEVYVLTGSEIQKGMDTTAFSGWSVVVNDLRHFIFWAFIGIFIVCLVFFISISRTLEGLLDPFLVKLRRYAPVVSRITIGLSFYAAAYYQAVFGPELPIAATFGSYHAFITATLVLIATMITFGYHARLASLVALVIFSIYTYHYGWYMITYTNYLGEIIVLLILGAHRVGFHSHADKVGRGMWGFFGKLADYLAPYSFMILRICFGISLLYASLYAKFFHNILALQVASLPLAGHASSLASVLGFEPHFLVMGAGIVEIIIGLFFLFGIEIRFTALFLEFWLTLSLLYFGEIVWPHLILIGIPIAFMFYGYDKKSLEGYFFKDITHEPVL